MSKKLKVISLIFLAIYVACFVALFVLVLCKHTFFIDKFNEVVATGRNDFFNVFFKILVWIGSVYGVLIIAILTIFFKDKRICIGSILCVLVALMLNGIIKLIVMRVRPDGAMYQEVGTSFPSTHATITVALSLFLCYELFVKGKSLTLKICLTALATLLVILIGLSRIYFDVHYTSDVLAGWCLGISSAISFIFAYNAFLRAVEKRVKREHK
ncbi:MAG: phosphatase PAP2 family protein [Clostridia bacterium]|nr:phosphatase PAP2 family protein [Clostridia bacterium]